MMKVLKYFLIVVFSYISIGYIFGQFKQVDANTVVDEFTDYTMLRFVEAKMAKNEPIEKNDYYLYKNDLKHEISKHIVVYRFFIGAVVYYEDQDNNINRLVGTIRNGKFTVVDRIDELLRIKK